MSVNGISVFVGSVFGEKKSQIKGSRVCLFVLCKWEISSAASLRLDLGKSEFKAISG